MNKKIEKYTIIIISALAGLLALLDLFDLLGQLPWLSSRITNIVLLLVSSLLALSVAISDKLENIQELLERLNTQYQFDILEKMKSLRKQLDPNLEVVFGEHVLNLISGVESAVKSKQINLYDVDLFRYFYRKTLEKYPKATFYATSLPYKQYFWKDTATIHAMAKFIEDKGKFKRIFFVSDSLELETSEVQEILNEQQRLKIETYTAISKNIPKNLNKLFVVESQGKIAWEALVDASREITSVIATSDPEKTGQYLRIFNELLILSDTKKWLLK